MREMISMVVVLAALTAISGGLLASIKNGTETRIANQIFTYQLAPAMGEIFTDVKNDPAKEQFPLEFHGASFNFYPAKLESGTTAVAFETHGTGFGGPVGMMIGINLATDEIVGVRVTTHSETPGLGSRAKDDPSFVSQFAGLNMDKKFSVKGDGGEIDAMSGATVTSKGVCLAAQEAQALYKELKPEILKHIQ